MKQILTAFSLFLLTMLFVMPQTPPKEFVQMFYYEKIADFKQINVPKKDKVRIMIIDTGVDVTNPILKPFFKPNTKKENLTNSHGTSVAGVLALSLIKAFGPNISKKVEFISCNIYKPNQEPISAGIECFERAKKEKIDIINYSSAGNFYIENEYHSIAQLAKKGIILITAAGNNGLNTDLAFPCNYKLPNIVCVGGLTSNNFRSKTSNFSGNVKFMAKGTNIYTVTFDHKFGYFTGTSGAAPEVASLYVAKMLSQDNETLAKVSEHGHIHQVIGQRNTTRNIASSSNNN